MQGINNLSNLKHHYSVRIIYLLTKGSLRQIKEKISLKGKGLYHRRDKDRKD